MLSDSMKQIFLELYEEENEYNSNINIKKGIFNVGYHDSFFSGKFMEKDSRICEKIIPEINESINNQSFKDKVVLLTRCHYKKENNSLSIVKIKHVERKLEELTTFEKIIEFYKSNFNDYYQSMGINQSNLEFCKDNYSAYCIAELFYENYKDSVNVNDRFFVPKDEDNPLVELYKTHGIELKLKDEYGLIKVDNNFEIKTINGTKLYDKRLKIHLEINEIFTKFCLIICLSGFVINAGADMLYAVQDKGLNDSQFFTINPSTLEVTPLSKGNYPGYDIEALDAHPQTSVLYAASGDDAVRNKGYLYTVNSQSGKLTLIGDTGFDEIEALSFHPVDSSLWAWAKASSGREGGLVKIPNPQVPSNNTLYPNSMQVEAMTWDNEGEFLYVAANTELFVYDINSVLVNTCNLSGETESLEILPDGRLLVGMHGESNLLPYKVVNAQTCQIEDGGSIATGFDDVEGIAWNNIPAPTIDLDHGIHDTIIIEAGSKKYTGFTLDLDMHEDYDYLVTFEQSVVPEGGISLFHRYSSSGNVFYNSSNSLITERIDAFVPGIYKVTSKVNVVGTGVSDEHVLTVRVVEPGWDGDLSIAPPSMNPSAVNPDVSTVEVTFTDRIFGTENPPELLTLEEVDENGSSVKTLGQLNDAGNNGDDTAGDYVYSGVFTISSDTEGKKNYQTTGIHNGELIISEIDFFTVTRFPIGPPSAELFTTEYSFISPDTDQRIYLDKLIVAFVEGITPERIEEIVAAENVTIVGSNPTLGSFYLQINSDKTVQLFREIILAFNAYSEIKYIDIAVKPSISGYPDDLESYANTLKDLQHGLTTGELRPNLAMVRADETWLIATGTAPITFIDTGMDITHPDFGNRVTKEKDYYSTVESFDSSKNAHGTHVAGIAAASINNSIGIAGISPGSKIIAIKGLASSQNGYFLPDAITYAAKIKESNIINISAGVYSDSKLKDESGEELSDADKLKWFASLKAAVQYAANNKKKLIVTAAANLAKKYTYKDENGNEHEYGEGKFKFETSKKRYPCAYDSESEEDLAILCVGNSTVKYVDDTRYRTENIDGRVCSSTISDQRSCDSNFGDWVNIAAPGDHVMSTISDTAIKYYDGLYKIYDYKDNLKGGLFENDVTINNYGILSGTSMSTPLVSGAAAILKTIHTKWEPLDIMHRLTQTAVLLDPALQIGNRLDIFEAVFNGSFETGDLSEWTVDGACLAIQKLGPITPTHRDYMAICGSGPDYNKITSLSKVLKIQPGVTTLPISMDFNFVTEEYPEYVNAGYNDSVSITLKDDTGNEIFTTVLASVDGSAFCPNIITEDLAPGNGDITAGQTGWKTVGAVFNIPDTGGVYQIDISFDIKTDGDDDAYDSGILIDHIQLEYALDENPRCGDE